MARTVTSWALRVGAWLVLLLVIGRLVLDRRSAWLNGRIMQMEVLFESRHAENALFRELGLDRHFDPDRYRIRTTEFNRFTTPVWLQLTERDQTTEDTSGGHYIWLNRTVRAYCHLSHFFRSIRVLSVTSRCDSGSLAATILICVPPCLIPKTLVGIRFERVRAWSGFIAATDG